MKISNFRASDPSVIQLALSGFVSCVRIAYYYQMSDVFDNIVVTLCRLSTLLPNSSSLVSHKFLPALFFSHF